MRVSKYPPSIRELGQVYRRKSKIPYVKLPQLMENLTLARKAYIDYDKWYRKYDLIVGNISLTFLEELQDNLRNQWLSYFGPEAEKELQTMHQKSVLDFEKEIVALIFVNYEAPDTRRYRSVTLRLGDRSFDFATEDPCKDFNDALHTAQQSEADEIIFNDSCYMFVLHSKGRYAFNLAKEMVRVERE